MQIDPLILNQCKDIVHNALVTRAELIRKFLDPRRSINDECGYPDTGSITIAEYRELYDRESVAARVVNVLPQECWKTHPTVYEHEAISVTTEFEKQWQELSVSLQEGDGWFKDEQSSPIWDLLKRADEYSGIGHYGVILLGIDDGKELFEPADGLDDRGKSAKTVSPRKLLYARVFDESLATVSALENDPSNPRFGQPTEYEITFIDPKDHSGNNLLFNNITQKVHWTRILHIADNCGSNTVFGVPRMRPVFNRLLDLRKLYSGSAEMYWRGAFPGLSIESQPQLLGEIDIDKDDLRTQIEQYMNGLQRYLALTGLTTKSLAPQVVNPTSQIDAQITAICVLLGIPKRVFMGSEKGSLASNQDHRTWNDRLAYRQVRYITPKIIVPFVNRLIALGVLPKPKNFNVEWPDIGSISALERAEIASKVADAVMKYLQPQGRQLIHPIDFLSRVLGYSEEEATTMWEKVKSSKKELQDVFGVEEPPVPPGTQNPKLNPGQSSSTKKPVPNDRSAA